ncbi:MAG: tRNA pseudouridine55 synthase [Thermoleophilaceae bacterium]|nr:tRNA pseudouridine55 synthase [Thermoleophilaceae bacterium]
MTQSGVILYAKPPGITSHDVVARVRRELREQTGEKHKVGHAGTLDPFATGLLLVLVGPATRAQRFFMALPKTYRAVARLGWRSTTGDPEGELVHTGQVPASLEVPVGDQMQRPHAFSAVKVGGERLYKKARRGELVEAPPRKITVYASQLLSADAEHAELLIECSSGTYVRQLVADLGDAYCEQLERTAIGPFKLEDADPERVVPLAEALAFLPGCELDEDDAERVSHGVPVGEGVRPLQTGDNVVRGLASVPRVMRLTHGARVLAIAEPRDGRMKPLVVFPA